MNSSEYYYYAKISLLIQVQPSFRSEVKSYLRTKVAHITNMTEEYEGSVELDWKKKEKYMEIICPCSTLSTINPTWIILD
jgi:hypothetical protein